MERAYKFRMYPNESQKILLAKTFGCTRFVYNYFLAKRIEMYEKESKSYSYNQMSKDLTVLKNELVWLKEPDKDALQKSLKHLDEAYQSFFKLHAGYPKFKSKKSNQFSYTTSCTNENIKYLGKYIQLPKLGKVKIKDKQVPSGRILNATVSKDPDGKYYVSLCCTDVEVLPKPKTNMSIGIDLGIADFAIMSNGERIANPRFYESSEKKLIKLQRDLSRKTIGSNSWNKNRIKVARLQKHIANQRKDFLQKLTSQIVSCYDAISIEDLDVSSMKETDSTLRNKRVGDVSFYEFKRQLEYKCDWYGKQLVKVNQYFPSSQICHVCGTKDAKKDVSIRKWICPACKSLLDRDLNAAINLHNEGLKLIQI